jgi:hypothetical protein
MFDVTGGVADLCRRALELLEGGCKGADEWGDIRIDEAVWGKAVSLLRQASTTFPQAPDFVVEDGVWRPAAADEVADGILAETRPDGTKVIMSHGHRVEVAADGRPLGRAESK